MQYERHVTGPTTSSAHRLSAIGIRVVDTDNIALAGPDGIEVIYHLPAVTTGDDRIPAVLLDLDGTSLDSEPFWVSVLEATLSKVGGPGARFESLDRQLLQGSSTRSHLWQLIDRHGLNISLPEMSRVYDSIAEELFFNSPIPALAERFGLKHGFREVLEIAKTQDIPVFLVTNGNRRKAGVEMDVIAWHLDAQGYSDICDGVWCAPPKNGWLRPFGASVGKPHPWPYLEAVTGGLGITEEARHSVIAVDDTAAGVCSIRLAGLRAFGIKGGNIEATGADMFCEQIIESLMDLAQMLKQA